MDKLKRCPFCGGKVNVHGSSRLKRFTIYHKNPRGCYFEPFEIAWESAESLAEAAKIWNRRVNNEYI